MISQQDDPYFLAWFGPLGCHEHPWLLQRVRDQKSLCPRNTYTTAKKEKKNLYRNNSSLTSELEAAHTLQQLSLEGFESGMMVVGFSNRKTRQLLLLKFPSLHGLIKKNAMRMIVSCTIKLDDCCLLLMSPRYNTVSLSFIQGSRELIFWRSRSKRKGWLLDGPASSSDVLSAMPSTRKGKERNDW